MRPTKKHRIALVAVIVLSQIGWFVEPWVEAVERPVYEATYSALYESVVNRAAKQPLKLAENMFNQGAKSWYEENKAKKERAELLASVLAVLVFVAANIAVGVVLFASGRVTFRWVQRSV
jgi:hypothetical protein